ncbi:hypothetical protein COLO4_24749 [Corchorus olitorius]|uniref:Oxoglutarate/iron-dependent dioxygenase n=1 Tax=Corchorus olitorius TaxID=93759 RepID=A0A1R3I7A3_9ROSI|nr:hypothetical protein COLO4_24749 [Corchorus olitorius]
MERKENLDNFIVGDLPTLIYIPEFIADSEQAQLLNNVAWSMKRVFCHKIPHQDGPAYYPVVAILSLGSPVVMNFTPHSRLQSCESTLRENVGDKASNGEAVEIEANDGINKHHPFSILLMPRNYLHGIEDSEVHQLDQVINETEALSLSSSGQGEVVIGDNSRIVNRTKNRISLTCRLVLKVHKNLFKF